MEVTRQNLTMAQTWRSEEQDANVFLTVGIHPCNAHTFRPETSIAQMRQLLKQHRGIAVAIGECGLDYWKGQSPPELQRSVFRHQVQLAIELQYPLFLHERNAHQDFIHILDEFEANLPPIVVHCFTGTHDEAMAYLERGFYLGFTGIICRKQRGEELRAILADVPLDRIMVETDAPFMPFNKNKRRKSLSSKSISEPADVVGVAQKVSDVLQLPFEDVCRATTQNALRFFGLEVIM